MEKICLVTGATSGIGKETALGLARMGANVTIVGRNPQITVETVAWLKKESANEQIHFLLADLSSLEQVRRVAKEFKEKHPRLDILVNNAGAIFLHKETSSEGFEKTWALNVLSPFLLTLGLLDHLKASKASRIVNVASKLHANGKIDFENLQGEKSYKGTTAYNDSKLAVILWTNALARRLHGTTVTVNSLHPGVVATGIASNTKGPLKFFVELGRFFVNPFLLSPAEGAKTSLYAATSEKLEGVTGKYFDNSAVVESSPLSHDINLQERVWDVSLALTTNK